MPTPLSRVLTGNSQGIAHLSAIRPNNGWATEDSRDAASTMPEAIAYVYARSATNSGTSAATPRTLAARRVRSASGRPGRQSHAF
jgi:hypothetical protein